MANKVHENECLEPNRARDRGHDEVGRVQQVPLRINLRLIAPMEVRTR